MWKVLGILLAVWLAFTLAGAALSFLGFLFKAALWVAVVGGVLFVGTAAIGWAMNKKKQLH